MNNYSTKRYIQTSIIPTLYVLMNVNKNGKFFCSESVVQTFIIKLLKNETHVENYNVHFSKEWYESDEITGYKYMARQKNHVYSFVISDNKLNDE